MRAINCTIDQFLGPDGKYFAPTIEKYRISHPGTIGGYTIKGYNRDGTIDVYVYTIDSSPYANDPNIRDIP